MQRTVAFQVPARNRRDDAKALFDAPAWVFDLVRRPGGFVLALQSEPGEGDADIVVLDDSATRGRVIARGMYHAEIGFGDRNVAWVTCAPAGGPCAAWAAPMDGRGAPRTLTPPYGGTVLFERNQVVYRSRETGNLVAASTESTDVRVIAEARTFRGAPTSPALTRSRHRYWWWSSSRGPESHPEIWSIDVAGGEAHLEKTTLTQTSLDLVGSLDDRALIVFQKELSALAPGAGSTPLAPIPPDCSAVRAKTVGEDVILQCSRMRAEGGMVRSLHRLKAGARAFEPLVDDVDTFDVDDRSVYFAWRSTVFAIALR